MPTSATVPTAPYMLMSNKPVRGEASGRRKAQVLRGELDMVSQTLEEAKEFAEGDRGVGACWPKPLAMEAEEATLRATMAATGGKGTSRLTKQRRLERPETPTLGAPADGTGSQHRAIVLLQRLLRGRAAQNEMFEGKERRIELIRELQMEQDASLAPSKEASASASATAGEAGAAAFEMLTILSMPDADERNKLLAASEAARRKADERELDAAAARIQAASRGRQTRAAAAKTKAQKDANGGLPNVADFDAEDQSRVLKIQVGRCRFTPGFRR